MINLVGNALDALRRARRRRRRALEIAVGENLAGTEVWLRVRDNGPGIEREHVDADLFDPFFTSKANGTGLGLAITQQDRRGARRQRSTSSRAPGRGTEFVVTAAEAARLARSARVSPRRC